MLSVIAPTNFVFKQSSSLFNKKIRISNNQHIVKTTSSTVVQNKKMIPTNDPAGTAEKLNGRLAMLGFLAGSGY